MKVLIVEDEIPAQLRLQKLFEVLPEYTLCPVAAHGEQALEFNRLYHPDIVLLDIHLPGLDGLETARQLSRLPSPPALIFTTAYEEHALTAFTVRAAGYLLKPIRLEKLVDVLNAAQQLNRAQQLHLRPIEDSVDFFISKSGRKIERISLNEVIYFTADQKYTTLRHLNGTILIEESLKQIELQYPEHFLRIHRSTLIAPPFVKGLIRQGETTRVEFRDISDTLEISRRHLALVKRVLRIE